MASSKNRIDQATIYFNMGESIKIPFYDKAELEDFQRWIDSELEIYWFTYNGDEIAIFKKHIHLIRMEHSTI